MWSPGKAKADLHVGSHVAVSPGALPRFPERFEPVYGNLGKADRYFNCRRPPSACYGCILSSTAMAAWHG